MSSAPGPRTEQSGRRGPLLLVAMTLVVAAVMVTIGSVLLAHGNKPAGVFLIVIGVLLGGCYLILLLVWFVLRNPTDGGEPTGRIIARVPPGGATWSVQRQAWTWTGGGSVLGSPLGRLNASAPLAVLELSPSTLTLRVRPGGLFGVGPCSWAAGDPTAIYPVRGRWVTFNRGLAIADRSGVYYFWTRNPERILAALEEQRYPVSWAEHFIARTPY